MDAESKVTTEHEEIKRWVEERKGRPAVVKSTKSEKSGVLCIDFPGDSGKDSLEQIDWDDFFEIFDQGNLAFLYQDRVSSAEESRFFKFIARDKINAKPRY